MRCLIIFVAILVLGLAPAAKATPEIMIKANGGQGAQGPFTCVTCHEVTPSRLVKFKRSMLTEEGRKWRLPKKHWYDFLFGAKANPPPDGVDH